MSTFDIPALAPSLPMSKIDVRVPLRVSKGRKAEHVASVADMPAAVRYAVAVDSGIVAIEW